MVKIQLNKKCDQYVITLPKTIVKLKGWRKGIELFFVMDNMGNISIKEVK